MGLDVGGFANLLLVGLAKYMAFPSARDRHMDDHNRE